MPRNRWDKSTHRTGPAHGQNRDQKGTSSGAFAGGPAGGPLPPPIHGAEDASEVRSRLDFGTASQRPAVPTERFRTLGREAVGPGQLAFLARCLGFLDVWFGGRCGGVWLQLGEHFIEQRLLVCIDFGRRSLLVTIIVIVITGAAANFSGFGIQYGDHGVVHDAFALNAKVVDDISEADFPHSYSPVCRSAEV